MGTWNWESTRYTLSYLFILTEVVRVSIVQVECSRHVFRPKFSLFEILLWFDFEKKNRGTLMIKNNVRTKLINTPNYRGRFCPHTPSIFPQIYYPKTNNHLKTININYIY